MTATCSTVPAPASNLAEDARLAHEKATKILRRARLHDMMSRRELDELLVELAIAHHGVAQLLEELATRGLPR